MASGDNKIRILALDGGGMLGTFASSALSYFEETHNVNIRDTFDLVACSSTGSIIASCLAAGKTAGDITEFYKTRGRKIFDNNVVGSLSDNIRMVKQVLLSSKYTNKKLKEELNAVLGDMTIEQAHQYFKMCISTYNITDGVPRVFKTPHHPEVQEDRHMKLSDAVVCSSSAPTFFPPNKYDEKYYVDGGTWIQNPSIMGVVEAKEYFINPQDADYDDFLILSVATATIHQKTGKPQPKSLFDWGTDMFGVMLSGQAVSTHHMMKKMFNFECPDGCPQDVKKYARINCEQGCIIKNMTGDNTDPAVLDELARLGKESSKLSYEANEELYKEIFRL